MGNKFPSGPLSPGIPHLPDHLAGATSPKPPRDLAVRWLPCGLLSPTSLDTFPWMGPLPNGCWVS